MAAGILLAFSQAGWAVGTPSGTTISNSATLAYSIGGTAQPDITPAAATFLVDEKINLTVAGGMTIGVASGSTAQATAFTVTNNANSPLDFNLAVTSAIAAVDVFDPTACSAFVESNAVPDGYQAGTDTATFIDELPADATLTVYAVCNIPAALAPGNTGVAGLTATARGDFNATGYVATPGAPGAPITATAGADTVNMDIVFADVAGTEELSRDAAHSDRNTYVVANASLTISKTIAGIIDPNGTAELMPGAEITYQIVVAIAGTGTVSGIVITDPLPAETTYVNESVVVDGAAKTDAADADNVQSAANTVSVSLGNVAAPANIVITFRATIN